ncbi:uncharacterized protein LOC143583322 [Bidens hawaiensis]|uniref:uncharacterized protein LOC143583322 n=1 Tax=Bidens hawaiensis TaxID=980011 RepID=UPI0040496847
MEDKQTASERIRDRNIMDMLRDDQSSGPKKNWKVFRDKLRLKRTGRAWTSSVPVPASDIPMSNNNKNRMMTKRGSWRYQADDVSESNGDVTQSIRILPLDPDPETGDGNNSSDGEQKPAAGDGEVMSLMSLLSTDGSNYHEDEEAEHVAVEEEEHVAVEEVEHVAPEGEGGCIDDGHVCSGCKGKFKGTALGVCGHTFCKQCTKEYHVSKGNCPTCNDYILEILDIF